MSNFLRSLVPRALEHWLEPRRLVWLGAASIVLSVASLVVVPFVLLRLPEDYLVAQPQPFDRRLGNVLWSICRNLLGLFALAAGLLMLVLPGQGLLTILVALLLLDFPKKTQLIRFALGKPRVLGPVNRLRQRAGRAPLRAPEAERHSPQSAG